MAPNRAIVAFGIIFVLAAISLINFLYQNDNTFHLFFQQSQKPVKSAQARKQALIISIAAYHYEVLFSFAWLFHSLDHEVTVWLYSNYRTRKYFDNKMLANVATTIHNLHLIWPFSRWKPPIPTSIDAVVLITANMDIHYLKDQLLLLRSRAKVMYIVNHDAELIKQFTEGTMGLPFSCESPSCNIVQLADHCLNAAERFAAPNTSLLSVYPVFDVGEMFSELKSDLSSKITRNDKKIKLVIQGNAQSKRRRYDQLMKTLKHNNDYPWELYILGAGSSKLKIPKDFKRRIHVFDSVSFNKFYQHIAQADLMLSFPNPDHNYSTNRATSTVPAAISCRAPLLLAQDFLQHYPCYKNGSLTPIHNRIAKENDSESLQAYFTLSLDDRIALKAESHRCYDFFIRRSQDELRRSLQF
jgi:hypothetical protein